MLHAADERSSTAEAIVPAIWDNMGSIGIQQSNQPSRNLPKSVANMAASLGKHEQVVARLRQQLTDSLASHQQRLMQDLEVLIQQTAAKAAAEATAGAAVGAAAGAAALAALQAHMSVTVNAAASSSNFVASRSLQQDDTPRVLVRKLSLQRLRAAAAGAQLLQQQLSAAETKLDMHRAAAVAAKQRMHQLEQLLQQQQQQQPAPSIADRQQPIAHQQEQQADPGPYQHQLQTTYNSKCSQHHHQWSMSVEPQTPDSGDCTSSSSSSWQAPASSSFAVAGNTATAAPYADAEQGAREAAERTAVNRQLAGIISSETAVPHNWQIILSPRVDSRGHLQQALVQNQVAHQQATSTAATVEPTQGDRKLVVAGPGQSSDQPQPQGGLSQQQLSVVQHQSNNLLRQLHLALTDNTVLCYECMHLQQLLVQERLAGHSACQAVALKLASDIFTIRNQLEEVQLELDVQTLTNEVAELAAAASGQQVLPGVDAYHRQDADTCEVSRSGEQLRHTLAAAAPAASPSECSARHRASLLQLLEEHKEKNKAVVQELERRLSAIGSVYEDTTWADDIQQQLAAIEQSFTGEYSAITAAHQAGAGGTLSTAAAPAPTGRRSANEGSIKERLSNTGTDVRPKPRAYVTTPSGHVSVVSSRRGTEVLMPINTAYTRRSTSITLAGEGTLVAAEGCSSTPPATDAAPLAAARSRGQRRSTLCCMTGISEAQMKGQQVGSLVADDSTVVPANGPSDGDISGTPHMPPTLDVLRAAAEQLSSSRQQGMLGVEVDGGSGNPICSTEVPQQAAGVPAPADAGALDPAEPARLSWVDSDAHTMDNPVFTFDGVQMQGPHNLTSSHHGGFGSPRDLQSSEMAVQLVDALHRAAVTVLTQPPAVTARGQLQDHSKLEQEASRMVTGHRCGGQSCYHNSALAVEFPASGVTAMAVDDATCSCTCEEGQAPWGASVNTDTHNSQQQPMLGEQHSTEFSMLTQQLAVQRRCTQQLQQELGLGRCCGLEQCSCAASEATPAEGTSAATLTQVEAVVMPTATASTAAATAKAAEGSACCCCGELKGCKAALAAQHAMCEGLREMNRYLQLQLHWALEQMQIGNHVSHLEAQQQQWGGDVDDSSTATTQLQ